MQSDVNRLEALSLTCMRGDKTIFEALTLAVESSQVLQLHGGNGSGKTSLLRILSSVATPEAGSVRWNGREIDDVSEEYRRGITYIGHRRAVCEALTPLENLQFLCALDTARSEHECRAALATLGLADVCDSLSGRLSAGQIQRTALARLVLSDAIVWLLDEPFTALDRDGQAVIEQIITRHAESGGICVVATHQQMSLEATTEIVQLDGAQ